MLNGSMVSLFRSPYEVGIRDIREVCKILILLQSTHILMICRTHTEPLADICTECFFILVQGFGSLLNLESMFICTSGKDDFSFWVSESGKASEDVGE